MASINFVNEHKILDALPGTNLRDLALQAGIPLDKPIQRIVHFNVRLGPLNLFPASDTVEIDGKGVNARSEQEEHALAGRFLARYKVTPTLRLASQVTVTGDISVRTGAARELDKQMTKQRVGYLAVVASFALIMLVMFALIGLDLVKKM
ncbi:MAG TPA: hypothetical protein VI758_01115 [Bacteroidota bacterium]